MKPVGAWWPEKNKWKHQLKRISFTQGAQKQFPNGTTNKYKLYHIWHSQLHFMNHESGNKMCLQSWRRWQTAFHFNFCYKRALISSCHCHSQTWLILGSLSTRTFETPMVTWSELFSSLTCPHTTTITLLSIFSPVEISSIKIWVTIGL